MNVVDIFSGVGGLSVGFEKAGFNVVLANEIDEQIAQSYKRNHIHTIMVNEDIRSFVDHFDESISKATEGLDTCCKEKLYQELHNVNVVIGGPPCQGFSMAGSRIRKTSEFIDDPRNFLFRYYFKIIQKFEPQYFVFENVVGILSSKNGEILETIKSIFEDESNFKNGRYYLHIKVFKAEEYGVPQQRRRVIILGTKFDFDLDGELKLMRESLPTELQSVFNRRETIRDAIFDLKDIATDGSSSVPNHVSSKHNGIALRRMKQIKANENWQSLDEEIHSVHSGAYGRMDWDKPSMTITTRFDTPAGGRFTHPELDRTLTAREAARIQTFPDDFIFSGSKTSICKQIGNAVPPRLAEFLAHFILYLNSKYNGNENK
ncbi:DNA cytosine methyltransferase [Leyella stercorea]|uniref:DNA cytosine methyltransferase n=1 Tax=Leyella stercorea TaxID=363265 RepID=UPI00266F9B96|nr:DNA cytosine methyltransferase [Leyella stercorea]